LLARDDRTLAERENAIGRSESADGKVYLAVEVFQRSDGKRLWEYKTAVTGERPESHEKHNLATPTPVTDGKHIFAWFGNGQIVALDMQGREVWKRHLGQEYGSFLNQWGHGSSPALYKDALILLSDHHPASYLLALDAATGKERWKVDRGRGRVSHSTPVVVSGPRGDELIINSSARIDAYDPANGQLLWHAGSERHNANGAGDFTYFTYHILLVSGNGLARLQKPIKESNRDDSRKTLRQPGLELDKLTDS
jgi:outer membrane protein assembly factor BamB